MSEEQELGLETLLAVKDDLGIDLEDNIIKASYEIQRKHQFNHDRTMSVQAMEYLIDSYVERMSDLQKEGGN